MDLTGKNQKKGKPNLFSDIVERRRHEGDFHGVWKPQSRSTEGSGYMIRRYKALGMLLVCAVAVFAIMLSLRHSGPSQPAAYLPGDPDGGKSKPVAPGKPPASPGGLIGGAPHGPEPAGSLEAVGEPGAKEPDGAGEPSGADAGPGTTPAVADGGSDAGAADAGGQDIVRDGGQFVFRPVLREFKPLPELDLGFVEDYTWDDIKQPSESSEIKKEAGVVAHVFRYLRTHGDDLRLRADPDMTHGDMMRQPAECRGKAISLRVKVVKKYMNFGWPKNDSGVQDTAMLFCYPVSAIHGRAIFVVLVPQPLDDFREEEIYDLTGVFWKRYPYVNSSNLWQWQPLILTMHMTPAPPSEQVSRKATVGIIAAAVLLIIGMLFLVRGETREGQAKRAERIERRRRQQHKPVSTRRSGPAPLQPAGDPHDDADARPPAEPPAPPQPPADGDRPDDFQVKNLDD